MIVSSFNGRLASKKNNNKISLKETFYHDYTKLNLIRGNYVFIKYDKKHLAALTLKATHLYFIQIYMNFTNEKSSKRLLAVE